MAEKRAAELARADAPDVLRAAPDDWAEWLPRELDGFEPFGAGGQSCQLFRAGKVVLRAPRPQTKVDARASFRSHRVVRALALRIGAPHLALPAALIPTPGPLRAQVRSIEMVATPLLPAGYRKAASGSPVAEDDRLAAALLCVLTAQCDAVLKNVFVSRAGRPVLLDLDTCLGRPVWWGRASRPCFAPEGPLAYASAQDDFAALPDRLAALVREMLETPDLDLTPDEARALRSCAGAVLDLGLTRACRRPLPEPRA